MKMFLFPHRKMLIESSYFEDTDMVEILITLKPLLGKAKQTFIFFLFLMIHKQGKML
jgi:hypothetical protein